MALSITFLQDAHGQLGQLRVISATLGLDASYPTGGYSLTGSDAGVGSFLYEMAEVGSNSVGLTYRVQYNPDTQKIQVSDSGTRTTQFSTALDGSNNLAGTEANADQATGPTNFDTLFAGATFTVLAGTISPITSPDVPRNLVITIGNTTGGALNLFQGTTTFTATGTDQFDQAQSEDITLISTSLNKSVAAGKFRFVQGTKVFKTVTSITITNSPAGALTGYVGPGSRIGIPEHLQTPFWTDVTSATINATPLTLSATTTSAGGVDAAGNAINVGDVVDGDALIVQYNPTSEVPDGTNVSAVVKRVQFFGQ